MTPLQKIKEGIISDNIDLIIEGYNLLTSDKIVFEPEPEQRRQIPQNTARRRQFRDDEEFIVDGIGRKDEDQKVEARVEQFQPRRRVNLFADDGNDRLPEYSRRDREVDEANRNAQRASPQPRPYTPVKATCNSCGRQYSVNPIHVMSGGYRCDNCNRR